MARKIYISVAIVFMYIDMARQILYITYFGSDCHDEN